ncbi:MAG: heavy metal translocating P-type ATPase, partial [Clostridia bacterium]
APIAKLADQVSAVFVPIVMIVALVAFCVWLFVGKPFDFALSIGIAVLVISCPCALGLATPVAIMVGTGKAAEYGVLMKSAEALEILHTVQTIVLDKTGTVTTGKPQVTDLLPIAGTNADVLLRLAASLEAGSEHPLAEAIMERARASSIMLEEATDFHAEPGLGVTALMHGRRFFAGNLRYLAQQGLVLDDVAAQGEALALQGKTPLYFAAETQFLGLLGVADVVKPTSAQAIDALLARGLDVVLLTGDHQQAAEAVRAQLRIPRVIAEVLPEDKEREIRALQAEGKRVAMVGDGINDAPALASADVGIAIGAGTDIAMESADIVLMKNDLNDVVTALDLSRAVIRNVKENLFWAFFYNAIGIPLAAGVGYTLLGWRLNPMFGAAAMSLSSVCVVANALRLRTFRPSDRPSDRKKKKKHASKQGGSTMVRIMQLDGLHCMHCVD